MSKITDATETQILGTPITRSKFLFNSALFLSAVGLGTARAHSSRSLPHFNRSNFNQNLYRRTGKLSDRFPNILLYTQDSRPVRFYDDLIENKTVIIDFMWASCDDDCPVKTVNLVKVHKLLRQRVGRDILMLSISLEGKDDTPEDLQRYIKRYGGPRSGWLYLTGDYDDIEALRYSLGVYDLDPVIDADRESHAGIITFGNDRMNRWAALPALMSSRGIARTISRITRDSASAGRNT